MMMGPLDFLPSLCCARPFPCRVAEAFLQAARPLGKKINKRAYSQVQTVLRGCLACWLGTGDSPVSHATAVVALRLLGATGMGDDLVGHVDKA